MVRKDLGPAPVKNMNFEELRDQLKEEISEEMSQSYNQDIKQLRVQFNQRLKEISTTKLNPDQFKELRDRLNDSAHSLSRLETHYKKVDNTIMEFLLWVKNDYTTTPVEDIVPKMMSVLERIKTLNEAKRSTSDTLRVQLNMLTKQMRLKGDIFETN
jgi:6-pyruvoyl-tetrahydropterin synthase